MGDVFEYIIDGTSGLAPGGAEGRCIVAGVCSRGEIGKAYLLGGRSDLAGLLGVGPLVDALRDVFAAGGQNPVVLAVPVEGSPSGYITQPKRTGSGPAAVSAGLAMAAADVEVVVAAGGAAGQAMVRISKDGGKTFSAAEPIPADGQLAIEGAGARIIFTATEERPLVAGDAYKFKVVTGTSEHRQIGAGPAIVASGEAKAGGQLEVAIAKAGGLNVGAYRLSIDGGDNYGPIRTLPVDGLIQVPDLGLTLELAAGEYQTGTIYAWDVLAPTPTTAAVMSALEQPLTDYDVEFVYIVGPSDSVDWAACFALAEEQWNKHCPTFFICEARLPHVGEDMSDWATALKREREGLAGRDVAVVASFGEVADSTGLSKVRNWAGLLAGELMAIPVQRAAGRVRDGAIVQASLGPGWNGNIQQSLEDAGFVTSKRYKGLYGAYWGDVKTLADLTSDFLYIEVLRVVYKALRKARIAALKSMYDELGDPTLPEGAAGLAYLETNIGTALDTMVKAVPQEMAGHRIEVPAGQDYVNNGVAAEITLIGIPIIRQIKLFGRYVYAGSKFDPRLEARE